MDEIEIVRSVRSENKFPQRLLVEPDASKSENRFLPNGAAGLICRPFQIKKTLIVNAFTLLLRFGRTGGDKLPGCIFLGGLLSEINWQS